MAGRIQLVAAFFAGACLVAMAVVLSGQDKAQEPSLAAKKAMLRQASSQMLAAVTMVNGNYQKSKWPAVDISNSPQATGNKGWQWNYGSTVANDYGGALSKATAHGWTSGASTIHGYDNQVWSGGKGMFGQHAVDTVTVDVCAPPAPCSCGCCATRGQVGGGCSFMCEYVC